MCKLFYSLVIDVECSLHPPPCVQYTEPLRDRRHHSTSTASAFVTCTGYMRGVTVVTKWIPEGGDLDVITQKDGYRAFLCDVYSREKISIEHSRAASIRTRVYPGVTAFLCYYHQPVLGSHRVSHATHRQDDPLSCQHGC